MDNFDLKKDADNDSGEEVYSKVVRAGRRTYFFDVKSTRNNDYYLTITESRKKQTKDGTFFFDKHKIYLYKEDFIKFGEGLGDVIAYVRERKPEFFEQEALESAEIGAADVADADVAEQEMVANFTVSDSSIDEEFDKL